MISEQERDYNREYHLERYHARMREFIEQLGGKCVQCGSVDELEIDHIDPATKEFTIASRWGLPDEAMQKELSKCQLLCYDCHKEKSASARRVDVHGTWGMYRRRGCRCDECRTFVNKYMREWKRNKRQ
jgi:hypothetical protein